MLTKKQQKVWTFIQQYWLRCGRAPTVQEIADEMQVSARGTVYRYVKILAKEGYIELLPNVRRNIRIKSNIQQYYHVPLLGKIAAGQPIEAVSQDSVVDFTELFFGPDRFALRVVGDSMEDEGIYDGDVIICKHAKEAHAGDIVVALVDQQQATLKRIQFDNHSETVVLLPGNARHEPQRYPAGRVQIQGIYVGLCRFGHL